MTPQAIKIFEAAVETYLDDGKFHTWKELRRATGIRREIIRKLPLYNDGRLIGNAQDGIKLACHASADEIDHTIRAMRSHSSEIYLRSVAIEERAA